MRLRLNPHKTKRLRSFLTVLMTALPKSMRYLESVTELSERATEARLMADQRLADTQQGIYNDVAQAYENAENRKTEISARAAEQRADADERLADTQQDIYNSVADFHEMTEERKAEVSAACRGTASKCGTGVCRHGARHLQ